ncbi:hypothetical protein AAG906_035371 [Vitis piasezkii]
MDDLFDVQTNTQCSKMTCKQPPKEVLVLWMHLEVTRKEVPKFRTAKAIRSKAEGPSRPERPPLTPLSISYEKFLPMIQGMSDFRWPRPLETDPSKRDHSKRCAFHKEHGHTTDMQVPPLSGRKAH